MLRILLYGLLLYFLYRFVFNFLVPVIRTALQVKRQMDTLRNQAQQGHAPQASPQQATQTPAPAGEYIDFEEVR